MGMTAVPASLVVRKMELNEIKLMEPLRLTADGT